MRRLAGFLIGVVGPAIILVWFVVYAVQYLR